MNQSNLRVPIFLIMAALVLGLIIPTLLFSSWRGETAFVSPTPTRRATLEPVLVSAYDPNTPGPPLNITPMRNCTYNRVYWYDQYERWPAQIVFGGQPLAKDEMKVLFEIETADMPSLVIREAYVTFLNILNGVQPADIEKTVVEASSWVKENPPGSLLSRDIGMLGLGYFRALEQFNSGLLGPAACPDNPPTPVPAIVVGQEFFTPTPTATATLTPTPTATATARIPVPPPDTQPPPPPPPRPTPIPTATRTLLPTNTSVPGPTNTRPPAQPTNTWTPEPTPTQPPAASPTQALPPTEPPPTIAPPTPTEPLPTVEPSPTQELPTQPPPPTLPPEG